MSDVTAHSTQLFVLIHEDKRTTPPTVTNLVFASQEDAEAWLLSALSIVRPEWVGKR